jgi:hypothetical protein
VHSTRGVNAHSYRFNDRHLEVRKGGYPAP